jgi:hypothetical protein
MLVEISSQPKAVCGAAAVFQVICRNPHVLHKDHVVSTDILSLTGQAALQKRNDNTKTLFSPYFKNKTTLVAKDNTHIFHLITLFSLVFYYFWINSVELRCASVGWLRRTLRVSLLRSSQ